MILITAALLTYTQAHAHDYRRGESCIKESRTLIKEEAKSPAKCEVVRPLKLKDTVRTYPLINLGPLKVRYWDAELAKNTHVIKTYEHSFVNICSGVKTYSEKQEVDYVSSQRFVLLNPNFDEEISETFKLAPMTNQEAADAYKALEEECALNTSVN